MQLPFFNLLNSPARLTFPSASCRRSTSLSRCKTWFSRIQALWPHWVPLRMGKFETRFFYLVSDVANFEVSCLQDPHNSRANIHFSRTLDPIPTLSGSRKKLDVTPVTCDDTGATSKSMGSKGSKGSGDDTGSTNKSGGPTASKGSIRQDKHEVV